MAAGYKMTARELEGVFSDVSCSEPTATGWPFASMLARICDGDQAGGVADVLAPGRARFFRRSIGWREGRSRRHHGRVERLLDAAARPAIPVVRRGAGTLVVSPLRKIVSAPIALGGAIGSRLYLRAGRRK
jgi:hypothetical protein